MNKVYILIGLAVLGLGLGGADCPLALAQVKSPIQTHPGGLEQPAGRERERRKQDGKFREDQHQIGERSRQGVQKPLKIKDPLRPGDLNPDSKRIDVQ